MRLVHQEQGGAAINAPFLTRVLRSYQQRAATYLYERDAAFLIAPLGAGKGAAALTAIAELIRDGHHRHALVIAPKLVAETVWPQEVATWPHLRHLRIAVLEGGPERRRALLATAAERELTVIGVDLVPWLIDELAAVPADHPLFDILVIDETSRLKDPSGKRARALLKVARRFKTRWGLTGTPRPNSAMDLFMPAAIITDGALWGRAFIPWQKRHFRPRDPFGREWKALPGAEDRIAADFGTVAMTVVDADMPDLPPLNVIVTRVTLPEAVMAAYKTMQRELFAAVNGRAIEAVSPLVAIGKCSQLANGFLYDEDNEDPVEVHSIKIDWLRELVESLEGEPLLIAYEFIEDLRTIRRAFGKVPVLGNPTREAKQLIEDWNAGRLPLLAFHPASAGHGLNLQHGGSRMAWLSPSWSAELTQQAIARIYRPGQTQHVTIHVCVAAGTVDEMKRDRVIGKMSAQEAFRRHLERV
jgi:SNF2 family DNA or RNA helicase